MQTPAAPAALAKPLALPPPLPLEATPVRSGPPPLPAIAPTAAIMPIASSIVASPSVTSVQTPVFPVNVAIEPARPVMRPLIRDEDMPDCLDGSARTRRIKRLFLLVMILGLAAVFALMIASQFRPR